MNTKKKVTLVVIALCSMAGAHAQTYLDHLKQTNTVKGWVMVTQSKEIDALVNGKGAAATAAGTTAADALDKGKTANKTPQDPTAAGKTAEDAAGAEARRLAEMRRRESDKREKTEGDMETSTVDMRKKVMRGSHKVTGYRVQAFAGGNTRNDKQQAQQIGNAIKMKYPDLPIYVHFYSPRWICRVGNFRSYQEAERVLKQVRAMGYKAATIVKGQITVQY